MGCRRLTLTLGNTSGLAPPPSVRDPSRSLPGAAGTAAPGARASPLARVAGIVRTWPSVSISAHNAPRTSHDNQKLESQLCNSVVHAVRTPQYAAPDRDSYYGLESQPESCGGPQRRRIGERRPCWTDRAPRQEQPDRYCAAQEAGSDPPPNLRFCGAMGVPASHPSLGVAPGKLFPPGRVSAPCPRSHPTREPGVVVRSVRAPAMAGATTATAARLACDDHGAHAPNSWG